MTDLDTQVIEAAASAVWNRYNFPEKREGITFAERDEYTRGNYRRDAEVAIQAADAARAPTIRAALARLETALHDHAGQALLGGPRNLASAHIRVDDARRELLTACGIEQEGE